MEDTFKVRVDKAFGSLEASSSTSIKSTSSSLSSLWCLTDEEIERNKWIQDKIEPKDEDIHRVKIPKPYPPFLQGLLVEPSTSDQNLESDIQELDDDDEDEDEDEDRQPELVKPDDHSNDEWNIRSSVGMDCTLDKEEEEDAFDKVAVGKEESAERFYMKEVNDYEVEMDSNIVLPNSFTDVIKDPRANRIAAKLRLKEDDESASKSGSEKNNQELVPMENQIVTEAKVVPFLRQGSSYVPDHVRNPSKYTHYTLDSMGDVDEEANRKAYMDFFSLLKGSTAAMEIQDDVSTDSSSSIIFIPKKKSSDHSMKENNVDGYVDKKIVPISIADSDVCMMDEDEPEIATDKSSSLQKGGRRYRTKGSAQVE